MCFFLNNSFDQVSSTGSRVRKILNAVQFSSGFNTVIYHRFCNTWSFSSPHHGLCREWNSMVLVNPSAIKSMSGQDPKEKTLYQLTIASFKIDKYYSPQHHVLSLLLCSLFTFLAALHYQCITRGL